MEDVEQTRPARTPDPKRARATATRTISSPATTRKTAHPSTIAKLRTAGAAAIRPARTQDLKQILVYAMCTTFPQLIRKRTARRLTTA